MIIVTIQLPNTCKLNPAISMDVGDATSTTSMDVVKVGLEKQVGLELEGIQGWKIKNFLEKYPKKRIIELSLFELLQKSL